jgi:hypothetical protein
MRQRVPVGANIWVIINVGIPFIFFDEKQSEVAEEPCKWIRFFFFSKPQKNNPQLE